MPTDGAPQARTLALINQKGGVGKTTTAVNLAAATARAGARVMLVDLDPQAHATLHLGVDPTDLSRSVYDLLLAPDDEPEASVLGTLGGMHLVPSETDLAAAEVELAQAPERTSRLSRSIDAIARAAGLDLVLIDCPPSLGLLTLNALAASDAVLIPMQAHFLALQGVGKLLETVGLVASKLNPRLRVEGVVLCMHDSNTTHAQEVVADLDAFFAQARGKDLPWSGASVLHPPIRRNIKLAECPSFGATIFDYAPTAAGAADYAVLARAVLGRLGVATRRSSIQARHEPPSQAGPAHGGEEPRAETHDEQPPASPTPQPVVTPAADADRVRGAGVSA